MLKKNNFLDQFLEENDVKRIIDYENINASSIETLALTVAASFIKQKENIAVVLPTLFDAQTFLDFISAFLDEKDLLFFPFDEVLRLDAISSSKEMLKERVYTLNELVKNERPHIFITHAISVIREVSPKDRFSKSKKVIRVDDILDRKELLETLVGLGYARVNKVENVFEFSARGEIVDIFSPTLSNPVRIEYFDDCIEEIRVFDVASELSFDKVGSFEIVPATENVFTKEEIEKGVERINEEIDSYPNKSSIELESLLNKVSNFISNVEVSNMTETEARFIPYFKTRNDSVLDYLDNFKLYFYNLTDCLSVADNYKNDADDYFKEIRKANLALKYEMNCFSIQKALANREYKISVDEQSELEVTDIPYSFSNVIHSVEAINKLKEEGYGVKVFLPLEKYDSFASVCKDNNRTVSTLENGSDIEVTIADNFKYGFLLKSKNLVILTLKEIFGINKGTSYFLNRFKEAKVINKYQDLAVGDFVVHEEHGIGEYLGIEEIDGLEYLKIKYAQEGQFLYVPLSKYKLIRKYAGQEGKRPKLDTLGGGTWARRKAKIRGRVTYLADKLIEIDAIRNNTLGFAFQEDDELEEAFAKAFPYELTVSQAKALKEIKEDMESPRPMDRLLAGDVGFGKTEVAFRAAYKAILSGKQVALLCPTTVLCKQHGEVASARFKDFGVRVRVMSRNQTAVEQKKIIEKLKSGYVHLVIGTHRLLSNDVKFKDLGLLIVDEEQRFGVTHKEKIKELTNNVDVLTLTATPIPRTLQMSLLNVRQLSTLNDPPFNRLPIKTYVVKYDNKLIKEVIARELGRKGQVYYLHNRISSIYKKAEEIEKMFPQAKVSVVHGQLDAEDMSEIMTDFYEGKIDILVCTTIIETGLDVSNCNTIIVENAGNFGLAQLYQIKGRVGRSSRLAYAYLTYKDVGNLTDDSKKRLKALKEFTELGSGYKIATQDLNIRGAGDILGKEQAGFIDSIGYEAYMNLLSEVMKEKTVVDKAKKEVKENKYELSFSLDSHIPANYASEADRINIYRDLFDITDKESLFKYKNKVKDVFGKFTEEMENLFVKKEIEIDLNSPWIESFKEGIDQYNFTMIKEYSRIPSIAKKIKDAFEEDSDISCNYRYSMFSFTLYKTSDYLLNLYNLIESLLSFVNEYSK